jgi:hypothetical protein
MRNACERSSLYVNFVDIVKPGARQRFVAMTMTRTAETMEPARPVATPITAAVAGGGEPPYDGGMEHRMTALETRLDLILPTLATKADLESVRRELENSGLRTDMKLAELRADMHKMNAEIRSWTLATMITIVGAMLAAIFGISQIYKGAVPAPPAPQPAPIIITIPGAPAPPATLK